MDLMLMALAILGAVGWLWAYYRHFRNVVFGFLTGVAVIVLTLYFLWVLFQSDPSMMSSNAQVGWPIVALMAFGVCMLLSKPKPTRSDGDAQPT